MINTPEIINYLYLRLRNGECYIKQNESNLIIKIFSPLIDSFINETPYRYKIGEYISLKLLTYTKESIIFYKNENELEFICSKKDELKPLYDFFSYIQCKKIVSDAYSCNCPKFLCFKCLQTYTNKNKDCLFRKNSDIDYIILNIFEKGKIKKEKINLYVLKQINLKDLYLKNELNKIIIPDYNNLTPRGNLDLIGYLTTDEILEKLKNFENEFTAYNILDLISTIGSLVNNYINTTKKSTPGYFIDISEALKSKSNSPLFISGIMAKYLSNQGINVAIEEKSSSKTLTKSLLDWLLMGLLKFKKIILHLDYGETKNNEILENEEEKIKLLQYWKDKISQKVKNLNLFPVSVKKGSIELTYAVIDNIDDEDISSLNTLSENNNEIKDIK